MKSILFHIRAARTEMRARQDINELARLAESGWCGGQATKSKIIKKWDPRPGLDPKTENSIEAGTK
jgi:hypothetical protein